MELPVHGFVRRYDCANCGLVVFVVVVEKVFVNCSLEFKLSRKPKNANCGRVISKLWKAVVLVIVAIVLYFEKLF